MFLQMKPADLEAAELRKQRIHDFVYNSEMMSGRGFDAAGKTWEREGVKRHIALAADLCKPSANFVCIELINSTLAEMPNDWFRSGIEGMFRGQIPDGKDVPRLVMELDSEILNTMPILQGNSPQEKDAFAWHAHDRLMCYHAFKARNGRTARMLYNHVRALLGLEPFVILYNKSEEYFQKLEEYKQNRFLAELRTMRSAA